MPVLKARWEKFAQLIARGECKSNAAAYLAAGYDRVPGDTAKVRGVSPPEKACIAERIKELQAEFEQETNEARKSAFEAMRLTREFVINELLDTLRRAKSGKRIDGATANRACELLGKELGRVFVDRSENTNTIYGISDKPLTPEEWEREWAEKQTGELPKQQSSANVEPGKSRLN